MSKQSIWSKLKAKGFSDTACAAIMGNMQQESALKSNNVEDRSGIRDETYTNGVDSGLYPEESFVSDSYGYGLCQWTAKDRKRTLIQLAKQRGVSIADEGMQIDLMVQELHQSMYKLTWDSLNSGASLREMTGTFMRNFERPYDQSEGAVSYRTSLAQAIYDELAGTEPTPEPEPQPVPPEPEPEPDPDPKPEPRAWPPRTIDWHCSDFPEIVVLTSVLFCRGYLDFPIGYWDGPDGTVTKATEAFQKHHGLVSDGVVGPLTWDRLLERR